jgi:hypothetical protein
MAEGCQLRKDLEKHIEKNDVIHDRIFNRLWAVMVLILLTSGSLYAGISRLVERHEDVLHKFYSTPKLYSNDGDHHG